MKRRTTMEIDDDLLKRARLALGAKTDRATVEEALKRVAVGAEREDALRSERQRHYLERLAIRIDPEVLRSGQMWR
jgi:Arc/MetJ family transcription regulator